MSDDEEIIAKDDPPDMGTVVLMLGLYLIMLAFFILLNAISEDSQNKRDTVVESVMEGFDFRSEGEGIGSDDVDTVSIPTYESTVAEVRGIVQAYLPIDSYDISVSSENIQVVLKPEHFYKRGTPDLIPDMLLFFQDLADILSHAKSGFNIISQVIVQAEETDLKQPTSLDAFELAGRRAAIFVRALIDEGTDKTKISAGALVAPSSIILTFYVYKTENELDSASKNLKNIFKKQGVIPSVHKVGG